MCLDITFVRTKYQHVVPHPFLDHFLQFTAFVLCLPLLFRSLEASVKNASFYGIIANAKGKHLVLGIFLSPNQLIPKSIIVLIVFLNWIVNDWMANIVKFPKIALISLWCSFIPLCLWSVELCLHCFSYSILFSFLSLSCYLSFQKF